MYRSHVDNDGFTYGDGGVLFGYTPPKPNMWDIFDAIIVVPIRSSKCQECQMGSIRSRGPGYRVMFHFKGELDEPAWSVEVCGSHASWWMALRTLHVSLKGGCS